MSRVRVRVSQGWLDGEERALATGSGSFYSFKGIPYAQPPLGELRFKAPRAPQPWDGVREATKHGPVCPHFDIFITKTFAINSDEDCLYLNVYTPNIKPNHLAPVMFWIHGGAFISGSGNDSIYGPDFLVEKGVVLVTFNYRLDALGFLCLDTEEVPGNAGMKDQVAALHWVKENIHNFGGDAKSITIFGGSAGAASVSYHLVSPMSNGLFQRAIMQSGSYNSDWANTFLAREKAFSLGKKLGITTNDEGVLLKYLQSVPVEKLIFVPVPVTLWERVTPVINISVVKEKRFGNNESFIAEGDNLEMIKDVEILLGYNTLDGSGMHLDFDKQVELLDTFLEYLVPRDLAWKNSIDRQIEIGRIIKDHYFSGEQVTKEKAVDITKYYSFTVFSYGMIRFLKSFKTKCASSAYLYKFSFLSEKSITGRMTSLLNRLNLEGVSHSEEIMYLFYIRFLTLPSKKYSESFKMVEKLTTLWTNFAKYGNPTPDNRLGVKWPSYTLDREEYLEIGKDLVPGDHLDKTEIDFWDNIYRKYNNVTCAKENC